MSQGFRRRGGGPGQGAAAWPAFRPAALSEYQDSLDRLRGLGGFDDDAALLEQSLPRAAGGGTAHAPEPAISPAEMAVFERFVELLASRQEDTMLRLAKRALNRARATGGPGGEPTSLTADYTNLTRSSEATSFASNRVAAERITLAEQQHALERQQAVLSGQRQAFEAERDEFEWVKGQLMRSLPDGAAARLQAQHRAVQARLQYLQMRADAGAHTGRERERAAAAALARAGRQRARREHVCALRLQCALRRRVARRRAEAARGEIEGRRGERAAQLEAGRARVRAGIEARERREAQQEAARLLQASERGRSLRAGPKGAALREHTLAKRQMEERLVQAGAAVTMQAKTRQRLARREAQARHEARRLQGERRARRHHLTVAEVRHQQQRERAATAMQAVVRGKGGRDAAAATRARRGEEKRREGKRREQKAEARAAARRARQEHRAATTLQATARRRCHARVATEEARQQQLRRATRDARGAAGAAAARTALEREERELKLRPAPPTVVLHSLALDLGMLRRPSQLIVEVELGSDPRMLHARLQRDCSRMTKSGQISLGDFEIAMPFDHPGVAPRLAALLSRTGQAQVDTDVVFTLYAAEGDAQPGYIGQAYVNLHECLRAAKDHVGAEEPQLVLETDDSRAVATLQVSVRALAAMRALVSPAAAAAAARPRATPKGLEETHYQGDTADNEWEWDLDTGG